MATNKLPNTPAKVEEIPYIAEGMIVTQAGTEYYVQSEFRGSLQLIRLPDYVDGFKADVVKHRVKAARQATEEERNKVYAMMVAKMDAEAAYRPGALVKATKASKHVDPNTVYVITKVSPKTVSIVELGGNPNNLYINSPRSLLAIVDPKDVLK